MPPTTRDQEDVPLAMADASLWDDTELLAIYNRFTNSKSAGDIRKDADNAQNGDVGDAENDADDFTGTSSDEEEREADDAVTRELDSASGSRARTPSKDGLEGVTGAIASSALRDRYGGSTNGNSSALLHSNLPHELQALVQSFYQAGFEAGVYTERQRHGKRQRE